MMMLLLLRAPRLQLLNVGEQWENKVADNVTKPRQIDQLGICER